MASIKYTWTTSEDEALISLVNEKGEKKWCTIATLINQQFGGSEKTGKQCRERWHNHLNPILNKESFTLDDEIKVFEYQKQYGNKWSLIAEHFNGRNDNFIKNCFYSAIRRNLRKYNKKKVPSKQLKGTISSLMRNPQTRKLLMCFPEHDEVIKTPVKEAKEKKIPSQEIKTEKNLESALKRPCLKPNLRVEVKKPVVKVLKNIGDITPTLFAPFSLGISVDGEFDGLSVSTPIDFYRLDRSESLSTTPLLHDITLQSNFYCFPSKTSQ